MWLDWAVIALYAAGMLAIGWYYSRRTKTREEYLLGGRAMKPLSVGVSLFASLISTISYLAWPGEMIKNGPMMLGAVLAYPLIALAVGWFMIVDQVRPPLLETVAPPSFASTMRSGFPGSIHRSWLSPWGTSSCW